MSSVDPFSSGSTVLHYRVIERVGPSVWRAEDVRSGRDVALKILTRQLPKDPARRESTVREVRLAAAIHHTFIVPIIEIATVGDTLVMVMEAVDGQAITRRLGGKPLDRAAFFRIAYQLAEAMKVLHGKGIIHGNINGDSVLVTAGGQVRLAGLNLLNLLQKKDGAAVVYQQKGSDLRSVSYMAPEQIAKGPVDAHTDVFCAGVVLYEMATGRLPYQGGNSTEIARAIVEGQPASPKATNPNIDNAVLTVLGRSLFKDPFRRYKEARAMAEDIATFDPAAAQFANELSTKPAAQAAAKGAKQRHSILLVADLANYDELSADDPRAATRAAARVQQVLGEAVYLFDGQIVDPFGPLVVAELPNVENALEAARKGEFDFSPNQQGEAPLPVRLLLHAGNVETRDGSVIGAAVSKAAEILAQIPPHKLHLSEDFLKEGKASVRVRDGGAIAGVKLFTIGFEQKPAPVIEMSTGDFERFRADTAARTSGASAAPVQEVESAAEIPAPKKRLPIPLIAGAGALIVAVGVGALVWRKRAPAPPAARVVQAAAVPQPVPTVAQRAISLQPFTMETPDPALTERGNAIRLATIEILRSDSRVRVADSPSTDAAAFSATIRTGPAGPELVPITSSPRLATGPPAAVPDIATGVQSLLAFIAVQLGLQMQPVAATAEVLNAFGDALSYIASNDPVKGEASLRTAVQAAPTFLPVQHVAMNFFDAQGKDKDALDAAKRIAALEPDNLNAVRRVARAGLKSGSVPDALTAYAAILKSNPADAEALNVMGQYAIGAGDEPRFRATLVKLGQVPPPEVAVHEPDMLAASGRIDTAIDQYYDIEAKEPNNPALSLKIGRIAILRRSMPIAELELKKLQQNDPAYGFHLLKAYIAAQQNNRPEVDAELKAAQGAARPWDDFWTSSAEIYAMIGDNKGVITSLQQAADHGEPTVGYILTHPLFAYLRSDADFLEVRARLLAGRDAMRAALAQIPN